MRGDGPAVEQLLALFPPAERETRPELQWLRGLAAMQQLDFDALLDSMQQAAAGFERAGHDAAALAQAYACLGLQHAGPLDEELQSCACCAQRPLEPGGAPSCLFASAWSAYARAEAEASHRCTLQCSTRWSRPTMPQLWHRCAIVSLLAGLPGMAPLLERFADGALRAAGDQPGAAAVFGVAYPRLAGLLPRPARRGAQWLARADEAYRWLGMTRGM